MVRIILPRKNQKATFPFLLLIVLLLSSCTHLLHLDRAQDAFSKGAELENAALFNPASISAASPESYYNVAYAEADKALKSKGKLQKTKVLGTTYSIKALSAWKLRQYKEARELAKTAKRYIYSGHMDIGAKANYPRDYAVMEAMDALITIQSSNDSVFQLLDKTTSKSSESAIQLYKDLIHNSDSTGRIEMAIAKLDEIINSVNDKHEVRVYFNMSQLAGLKVWSDAMSSVKYHLQKNGDFNGDNKTWYEDQEDLFEDHLKPDYLKNLSQKLQKKENDPVYLYWKFIL